MSRRLVILSLVLSIGGFVPGLSYAQSSPPDARTQKLLEVAHRLVAVDADGCLKSFDENEIVVCGIPRIDREHRLPFPGLTAEPGKRERVIVPRGNAEIVQQGRCYVTMNERNCFKGATIFSVKLGSGGGGVGGAAGRLWKTVEPPVPDEDYVKQAQIRPLSAPAEED